MASSPKTAVRRLNWKREILEIIRSTPGAGRTLIKNESKLSMESTLSLINELIEEGLIAASGVAESRGAGRKATMLSICENGCFFIGLRFNASAVTAVLMDFGLRIAASVHENFALGAAREDIIKGVMRCADKMIDKLGADRTRLRGIGVGAPGIIDRDRGVILRYSHVADFENVPLSELLSQRYDVPVYMEHGVKCASGAILTLPELSGVRSLIFMQIGRGASMSAVIDGQVYNGAHYLAGEIGQMRCEGGEPLEKLLSADSMLECYCAETGKDVKDINDLLVAADDGEACAERLVENAARACGQAVSNAVMVLDPEAAVLSSDFCVCERFCGAVKRSLKERLMPETFEKLLVHLMPHNAVLDGAGAAMLPYNHDFGTERS